MFRLMFSPRWRVTSVLVLVGIGLTIRLGIWQVDRYRQNKAFSDHLSAMQVATPLLLGGGTQPAGLISMEYRSVQASGRFDFTHQVAVRNQIWAQSWGNDTGYILITPLILPDDSAVMVDRGWIPLSYDTPASWRAFDVSGPVTVSGTIRLPARPGMGGQPDPTLAPGQASMDFWNFVTLNRLQEQLPYPILPVYIQQAPVPGDAGLPYRALAVPAQTPADTNAGFATMWFAFTALLFFGYPLYLRK